MRARYLFPIVTALQVVLQQIHYSDALVLKALVVEHHPLGSRIEWADLVFDVGNGARHRGSLAARALQLLFILEPQLQRWNDATAAVGARVGDLATAVELACCSPVMMVPL